MRQEMKKKRGETKQISHILNVELHGKNFVRAMPDNCDMHDFMMNRSCHYVNFNGSDVAVNHARSYLLGMIGGAAGFEAYVPGHKMRAEPDGSINPNYMVFLKPWHRYSKEQQQLWENVCGITRKNSSVPKCTFKSLYDTFELLPFFIENYSLAPPTFRIHGIGEDKKFIDFLEKQSYMRWGYREAFLRDVYMEALEFMRPTPLVIEDAAESARRKDFNEEEMLGVYNPLNGYPFDLNAQERLLYGDGFHYIFIDKYYELLLKHKKITEDYHKIAREKYDRLFANLGAAFVRDEFCNFDVVREHIVPIKEQEKLGLMRQTSNRPGFVLPMTAKNHFYTDFNGKKWSQMWTMDKLQTIKDREWGDGNFRSNITATLFRALREAEEFNEAPHILSEEVANFSM